MYVRTYAYSIIHQSTQCTSPHQTPTVLEYTGSAVCMHVIIHQCTESNLSKANTHEESVQFGEVSELDRFYMYSKYREQDLKTRPV